MENSNSPMSKRWGFFLAPPLSADSMGEHFYSDSLKIYHQIQSKF